MNIKLTRRRLALLAAAVTAVVAGVSYAAVPDGDGMIHACFDRQSGQLRIFDPETNTPKACGSKETAISWNQQGQGSQDSYAAEPDGFADGGDDGNGNGSDGPDGSMGSEGSGAANQ